MNGNDEPYKPKLTVELPKEEGTAGPSVNAAATTPSQTPHVSTNIFVAGLPPYWDEDHLRNFYKQYGDIISVKLVKKRHFGFVMFRNPADAHNAINKTHLLKPDPNLITVLHVSIAMHDEGVDGEPNERLFVRGLPQWATKEHLQFLFSKYGKILDCAVLMNPLGQCKGSGFVQFSTLQEADAALADKETIRMDDWPQPLELKYSEKPDVRRQRQERNRDRHQRSPKFRNNNNLNMQMNNIPISPAMYAPHSQPISLLPSPQSYAMMNPVPMPMMYPPSLPNTPVPTHMYQNQIYNVATPNVPFFQPQYILPNQRISPQQGDIHLVGGPLTEEIVRMLVQPFGAIELVSPPSNEQAGFIVRMQDRSLHKTIAQQLNGTYFSTGQLLTTALYA
ncbi:ELAV like protein 2/3/4 [Angomonas deanei]|uniref:RNA recognition motif. (A.k.a. RRM, RBD, or RNP domain), putative n=1 Tax=Angomonas deanei TaxID=59799 RepID=S9UZ79_9TRYP|nr:ELAV like protein 2/3/4 [Angomonas deanei]EPY27564.1 ELAV like protein 2/3/4 [Angomonas deanei]EPY34088.1 ELAV like protein 2/3/4 [Angomonas deanei]CAD2214752.1 RNA recognition motif. (a.k.a. RRM, RBD, or RNP domain), putative [Angomonas deanei]|eukprot:EPY24891.1 ELAV like protein 2/3/4 [Angomonas deanei]